VAAIAAGSSLKESGTTAPAARSAAFLASEVSAAELADEPAWPKLTEKLKWRAHVPMHLARMGICESMYTYI